MKCIRNKSIWTFPFVFFILIRYYSRHIRCPVFTPDARFCQRSMSMKTKKQSILIIAFAWFAYLISYMGRADYSACLVEIVNTMQISRTAAGLVTSVFSICNAFGQIGSGFLLKKFSPVKIIGTELFCVAVINFLFPYGNSVLFMALLWGMNGALQSTLLCSATRIFMETLKEPWLSKGAVMLNTVGATGGTLNYILTWFLIRHADWQTVFITVGGILSIAGILWIIFMPSLSVPLTVTAGESPLPARKSVVSLNTDKGSEKISLLSCLARYGALFMMTGCFMIGLMRESVSLWIPSYINEVFELGTGKSVIMTVFVPALQILGAVLGGALGRRFRNLHFPSGILFLISGLCMGLLYLAGNFHPFFSVGMFVINAICMTAALTLSLSLFPMRFLPLQHAPLFVGILNFFVHAGDFLASAGIGWLSQSCGWETTFSILFAIALMAGVLYSIGGGLCKKDLATDRS